MQLGDTKADAMRRRLILLLALFATVCSACATAPRNHAFVVGNGAYDRAGRLANPTRDATAIASSLEALGWSVELALDVSRPGFEASLEAFREKLGESERALFFYAGHGLQIEGENFIVPVEFGGERAGLGSLISLGSLLDDLSDTEAQLVVILDACRDSPLYASLADVERVVAARGLGVVFDEGAPGGTERYRPEADELVGATDSDRGIRLPQFGPGLAELDTRPGTLIAFATQPGNVALDGDGDHSPFTGALLEEIDSPDMDISTILRRTRTRVIEATDGRQVPWDHSSLLRSFVIYERRAAPPPP